MKRNIPAFYKISFSLLILGILSFFLGCTGSDTQVQKPVSYSREVTSPSFNFQFVSPWQVIISWKDDKVEHYIYHKDCPDCEVKSTVKVSPKLNYFIDSASLSHGFIGDCWEVRNESGNFLGRACVTMGADIFYVYVTQWNSEAVTTETREYKLGWLHGYGTYSNLLARLLPAGNPAPITATVSKSGVTLLFPRVISPPSLIPEYFSASFDYPEVAKTFPFATTLEIMRCDYRVSGCEKNKDFEVIDYISVSGSYLDPVTGGSYCYRVLAMNIYGSSGPGNTVCVDVDKGKTFPVTTSVVRVPIFTLEERVMEMYSTNTTLAGEMDKVLMGDPRFFKFRISRIEKVGDYYYNEIYDPSLTEGVYNTLFFRKNNFYWWSGDDLGSGCTYDDLFKAQGYHIRCALGYIFGDATAGEPFSDSTRHYLIYDYFYTDYLVMRSPQDWEPGFDTYVDPATFGVDFSKDDILVLYLRPFNFQLSCNAFFFFQPAGAYIDSNGVLHIVFASDGENYWRSEYVDSPDGVIPIDFESQYPIHIVVGIVLPESVVEAAEPYNIVFEWDLFAGYGDGVVGR